MCNFDGTGFIRVYLAGYFISESTFDIVYLLDIQEPRGDLIKNNRKIQFVYCDVRNSIIDNSLLSLTPTWIFNFAAVHREPGHEPEEYFQTNLLGAHNICDYARKVGCLNIYFTSSISVYGPCISPTDENKLPNPMSPYGSSNYPAELIHQNWLNEDQDRRLIIVRPGVIYGPGDPGNILRMIRAIQKGYFLFPGPKNIHKSYGYIFGLIDSIKFTIEKKERLIIYNYVEHPTLTIGQVASAIKLYFGLKRPIYSFPSKLLLLIALIFQLIFGKKSPIHPKRVEKAGLPTHIIPQYLIDHGFDFRFDFEKSLIDWSDKNPNDFK